MKSSIGGTIEQPGLDNHKISLFEEPSGAVNMQTIKGHIAVITGAAGGIGHALALDMGRRGAAGMALVDASDRVVQVAREINNESGHQVAIPYRGDTTDPAFRQEVYADVTKKQAYPASVCQRRRSPKTRWRFEWISRQAKSRSTQWRIFGRW